MDDVVQELRKRGGVGSWSELTSSIERDQLEAALADGRISRLRRKLYVVANLHDVRRLAIAAGGVASHLTAAQHWGWGCRRCAWPIRPCGRGR